MEHIPNHIKVLTLGAPWLLSTWLHFPDQFKLLSLNLDQAPISNPHTLSSFQSPRITLSVILCCPSCLSAFIFSYILIHFTKSVQASIKANALVSSWLSAISFPLVSTAGIPKSSLTGSVLHLSLGATLGQVWVNFKSPRPVSGQPSLKLTCLLMPFVYSPCIYSTPTPLPFIPYPGPGTVCSTEDSTNTET